MEKTKPYKPANILLKREKGTLLYLFLIPLFIAVVVALFKINIQAFLLNSISFALFFFTVKLSIKGFNQEFEYKNSSLIEAPKIPYKTIAAFMLGISSFFAAYIAGDKSFISSLFFSVIATTGYYMYYGFDPKEDKLENLGDISAEFVLQTIGEAKAKLLTIESNMDKIEDAVLHKKLNIAMIKAKNILKTIQEDPKDIRVARKFLIVYIDGIAKVTDSYVSMDEDDIDSKTKEKLYGLMEDLNSKFDKELERLKNNNKFDLDVHIDVLKEQIKN